LPFVFFLFVLFGQSRLCYHRSTSFAFYEHPIIAPKESQRNPVILPRSASKMLGGPAGEDEFIVRGGVNQGLAVGMPAWLLNDDMALGDHAIQPSGAVK